MFRCVSSIEERLGVKGGVWLGRLGIGVVLGESGNSQLGEIYRNKDISAKLVSSR